MYGSTLVSLCKLPLKNARSVASDTCSKNPLAHGPEKRGFRGRGRG
jgi:hypothetical protein